MKLSGFPLGAGILFFSLLGATSGVAAETAPAGEASRPPNLLIFFPDQMRRQALGFTGQDPVHTPNIDRFAREGLYFRNATSTFPVCTPWRGMMLTGRYPHETGITNNANSSRPDVFLRRDAQCITDVLHGVGYSIGYIGKWHLSHPHEPYLPQDQRTDDVKWDEFTPPEDRHHIDFWYAYNAYDDHLRPRYWSTHATRNDYRYVDQWSPEHEADVAIAYLENRDGTKRAPGKPFALWMSLNPPHSPYVKVPDRYRKQYDKTGTDLLVRGNVMLKGTGAAARNAVRDYFAAVTGVDEQFGRVLDTLKRLGLEQDTIVVFTSDHGDMMGSHGLMSKPYVYEEAFGVPMIFRWPGRIRAGRSDDLLISTPDLMPTLLALMGLRDRTPAKVQGTDYSAVLLEHGEVRRPDFAPYMDATGAGHRGVRTLTHTFIMGKERDGRADVRLFDNRRDPYQLKDISGSEPQLVKQLTETTLGWLTRVGDPWRP